MAFRDPLPSHSITALAPEPSLRASPSDGFHCVSFDTAAVFRKGTSDFDFADSQITLYLWDRGWHLLAFINFEPGGPQDIGRQRQFARAAKDYQLLYYKNPLSDEGKTATSALPQMKSALGNEYPAPSVELQEERAQILYNQHKWKDARTEFEKLAATRRETNRTMRGESYKHRAAC